MKSVELMNPYKAYGFKEEKEYRLFLNDKFTEVNFRTDLLNKKVPLCDSVENISIGQMSLFIKHNDRGFGSITLGNLLDNLGDPCYIVVVNERVTLNEEQETSRFRYKTKKVKDLSVIFKSIKRKQELVEKIEEAMPESIRGLGDNPGAPILKTATYKEKKGRLNNAEMVQKYLDHLTDLSKLFAYGDYSSIKQINKEKGVPVKVVSAVVAMGLLICATRSGKSHYRWIGGCPDAKMAEKVLRWVRDKKGVDSNQIRNSFKKGNFAEQEKDMFIDMLKRKLPYSVISHKLNRAPRLLAKQKFKLQRRGVDLTPYPDTAPTLFDLPVEPVLDKNNKSKYELLCEFLEKEMGVSRACEGVYVNKVLGIKINKKSFVLFHKRGTTIIKQDATEMEHSVFKKVVSAFL